MVELDPVIAARARAVVEALAAETPAIEAFVFGSHAEGRADQWSDIDVAVFLEGIDEWDVERRAAVSARIQRDLGDDIELHLFSASPASSPSRTSFTSYIRRIGVPIELP